MKAEFVIKNYRCFEDTKPLRFALDKGFTAFVGPNNAGKSSVLRFFYEFRNLWWGLTQVNEILPAMVELRGFSVGDINDKDDIFYNLNDRDMEIEIILSDCNEESELCVNKLQLHIDRNSISYRADAFVNGQRVNIYDDHGNVVVGWLDKNILCNSNTSEPLGDFRNILLLFNNLHNCMYIASFRNILNLSGDEDYFDLIIGTKFIHRWREWKTGRIKKQNDTIRKITQDIKEVFELKNLDISDSSDTKTLHFNLNDKNYKLNELGSGIAQFIIVVANAAIRNPTFILIDEPELHLHPTLQLDFLTLLSSYAQEGVCFATHSVGLARSVAERIYSVKQDTDGSGRALVHDFEETPHLAEFLGELSFRSFKDLGFDKILLVEGVNDLTTIQQFLRKLKEDAKIVLLPLGGSGMINAKRQMELSEIKRVSDNISVLIDSEKDSKDSPLSGDRQGFEKACRELGINIHVLERRAIENYFTEKAIQEIKGDKYKALEPYQKLSDLNPAWSKAENWRIAQQMSLDDIKATDLGKFLNGL